MASSRHDSNRPWRHLYKTARWERRRQALFAEEPLCRMCIAQEIVTAADTADHVTPHKGNMELFWNGELQPLCASCHSKHKQREEHGSNVILFGADGWPL